MPRITLSVPEELKRQLDLHPEIHWAELFRSALKRKVEQLKKFEELVERGEI